MKEHLMVMAFEKCMVFFYNAMTSDFNLSCTLQNRLENALTPMLIK